MAAARGADKVKRKKKRKSRSQVEISSSESESDVPQQSSKKIDEATAAPASTQQHGDVSMTEAHDAPLRSSSTPSSPAPAPTSTKWKEVQKDPEEFSSIYLRKVTVELADDLDKVRNAQDFKASSLPMLVHALRQGASIYSPEEKRRVVYATG